MSSTVKRAVCAPAEVVANNVNDRTNEDVHTRMEPPDRRLGIGAGRHVARQPD
jgi:hypothetical protein